MPKTGNFLSSKISAKISINVCSELKRCFPLRTLLKRNRKIIIKNAAEQNITMNRKRRKVSEYERLLKMGFKLTEATVLYYNAGAVL